MVAVLAGCATTDTTGPQTRSHPPASAAPGSTLSVAEKPAGRAGSAWPQIDAEARAVASQVTVYAADVRGRTVVVTHRSGPADPRPLASMVKLYVLYAVCDAIEDRRLAWDTSLTLRQGDRTGGSGSLGGRQPGVKVTVREAATLMMHISDNTATDLLIRTLGQAEIARSIAATGISAPGRLDPLPTIKQDLWLEWSSEPGAVAARHAYPTAAPAERTRLLRGADRPAARPPDLSAATPQWQHGLGYFASASDIAKVLVLLHDRSTTPRMRPLRVILHTPGGGIQAPPSWRYVAFKGGTVAGVQTGAWYAETPHGDQLLIVLASSTRGISGASFARLATDAAGLLAGSHP